MENARSKQGQGEFAQGEGIAASNMPFPILENIFHKEFLITVAIDGVDYAGHITTNILAL